MYSNNIDRALFLLHILSVIAAFAPAFSHALWARRLERDDPALLRQVYGLAAPNSRRINAPALVLAGLIGIVLVARNDELFGFDQTWVTLAFVVWIAMNGVLHGMILPGERKLAAGDAAGDAAAVDRVDRGGMLISLLFLFMLYLMIWKPGL